MKFEKLEPTQRDKETLSKISFDEALKETAEKPKDTSNPNPGGFGS